MTSGLLINDIRTDKFSAIIPLSHPDLNDISFSSNTHQRQGTNNAENRWCTTSVFLTYQRGMEGRWACWEAGRGHRRGMRDAGKERSEVKCGGVKVLAGM